MSEPRRPIARLDVDRRDDVQRDVDAEIDAHITMRVEQLMARGMTEVEARAAALERFGPLDESRAQMISTAATRDRRVRFADRMDALRHDLGYSVRQLRRSPAFAAAVIVTLGLGIGANATMFGAIDRLLLRPPPHVIDPARVTTVSVEFVSRDATHTQYVLSYPIYLDMRRAGGVFQSVAATRTASIDVGSGADTRSVPGLMVTVDYFRTLGAVPYRGRFFGADEAGDGPGAAVVVVGYDFWRRELGGDAGAIGRSIVLVGRPHTVIGVAPQGFNGVGLTPVDVWLPFTDGLSPADIARMTHARDTYAFSVVARTRPEIPMQRAEETATAAVVAGSRADGASDANLAANKPRVVLTSVLPRAARGNRAESKVSVLLGAVSLLVLLLACANVMNLQLARGIRRGREIAVRLALGVSRGRLVRQLAFDCLLLGVAGGAVGLVIAAVGGRVVRTSLLGVAVGGESPVDVRVLVFATAVSLAAGLVTGLVPALEMLRSDHVSSLRESAGPRAGESPAKRRLRSSLLVIQTALTTVLLVGTGLFVFSLRRIEAVPLGFEPDQVAVVRMNLTGRLFPATQLAATYKRLEEVARTTPGVSGAALALVAPFEGSYATHVSLPGRDSVAVTRDGGPYFNAVSPEYFTVLGERFVAGRAFSANDRAGAARVVIVNETAARLWWPNEGALGRCVRLWEDSAPCSEVVGVVANTHRQQIVEDDFVQVFTPLDQINPAEGFQPGALLFRATADLGAVSTQVQRRLQSASAGLPYVNVRPLDALIAPRLRSWRLGATMFGVFGGLALVLAAVGLYSTLAYDVAQRRHELGVRAALGAAAADLAILILGRGARTVALGAVLGAATALAAAPFVAALLFRTSARDPIVFVAVGAVLAVVCLAATGLPAWRAGRVDPSTALRAE